MAQGTEPGHVCSARLWLPREKAPKGPRTCTRSASPRLTSCSSATAGRTGTRHGGPVTHLLAWSVRAWGRCRLRWSPLGVFCAPTPADRSPPSPFLGSPEADVDFIGVIGRRRGGGGRTVGWASVFMGGLCPPARATAPAGPPCPAAAASVPSAAGSAAQHPRVPPCRLCGYP